MVSLIVLAALLGAVLFIAKKDEVVKFIKENKILLAIIMTLMVFVMSRGWW